MSDHMRNITSVVEQVSLKNVKVKEELVMEISSCFHKLLVVVIFHLERSTISQSDNSKRDNSYKILQEVFHLAQQ